MDFHGLHEWLEHYPYYAAFIGNDGQDHPKTACHHKAAVILIRDPLIELQKFI